MNKTIKFLCLAPAVIGALMLTGCNGNKGQTNDTDRKREPVPAIDLSAMDTSVRPQDDFYR